MTTTPTSGAADLLAMVSKALREAYNLGQRYWQQADSEYISQHKKADDTRAKFLALVEETCATLAAGQATASQAGEYPALVCDYCGALTPDPWHSSGMLHGKMSKHIHSCDACAARGAARAQDTREPLTPERVKEIVRGAGYDQCGIPDTERAAFINGLRHGEQAHGIKVGQHGEAKP